MEEPSIVLNDTRLSYEILEIMNPIILTREQRAKLLEMCRKLFPDYSIKYGDLHWNNELWFEKEGNSTDFHWFEFCMVHLVKRVAKYNNDITSYLMYDALTRNINPIDFLYEEVKKIKPIP